MNSYRKLGKLAFDLLLAIPAAIMLAPVMLITAAVIASRRDGPVFFLQERVGQNKKRFTVYKFRTMSVRAPETLNQLKESVVEAGSDQRITPIGRFLRASSIDELPQLLNVLKGEMSLIGPRPMIPEQLLAIPDGMDGGFAMRPGITGWAQVNGRRELDWLARLELDAWYAQNASLLLDIRIVFLTITAVFQRSGIYGSAKSNWRNYLPEAPNTQEAHNA